MTHLTIIIPTLNEVGNIKLIHSRISQILSEIHFEILFVDDGSQDGTVDVINDLLSKYCNVKLLRRINKRGIASAFIDGAYSSNSKYVAIMDADLQHDESLLDKMLKTIELESLDIVIGSRFKNTNTKINGLSNFREKLSRVGNFLSYIITKTHLSDPLSGFFIIRKTILDSIIHKLSGIGFKILLDILATCKNNNIDLSFKEIPMVFRKRNSGESKLDTMVTLEFLILLLNKRFFSIIPTRFLLFILVGASGMLIHSALLIFLIKIFSMKFIYAQISTTFIAMVSNFFLNNILTYRDRRIKKFIPLMKGLISFCVSCSLGAAINVTIAEFIYNHRIHWLISGILGGIVGAIWNYSITSCFTWKNYNKNA